MRQRRESAGWCARTHAGVGSRGLLVESLRLALLGGALGVALADPDFQVRATSLTSERQRSQHALVAVQMALALMLLVSSGLPIRRFQGLRSIEPGFTEPQRVQTFSISIRATDVADPERVTRMQHKILEQITAIPGIASAAFTTRLPMDPKG